MSDATHRAPITWRPALTSGAHHARMRLQPPAGDAARVPAHWSMLVKVVAASGIGIFAFRAFYQLFFVFNDWHQLVPVALVLVGELITLFLIVTAKRPERSDISIEAAAVTGIATFSITFIELNPGVPLTPVLVAVALQVVGIVLQLSSKLALGRCFGLLPARRGIVTRGPYRLVRHPIYSGYLIGHVGFWLTHASLFNFLIYAGLNVLQARRIVLEERVLAEDPEYVAYQGRVRWRFVPGLF